MKKFLFISVCLLLFAGCTDTTPEKTEYDIKKEFDILSSESELNALLTRGAEGFVDWELSKEFAQLALESYIEDGDYPASSELWDFPIGVYDTEGSIRYYEFRVVNDGNVIAAIACNAREDLGGPVSYIFNMNGYTDTLTELYNSGIITAADTLRIIDNAYPSYVFATVEQTRGGDINFDIMIDPETGSIVNNIAKVLTLEETFEEYPEMYTVAEKEAALVEIDSYRTEIKELWATAKTNKGNLNNFVFRGSSKKARKEIDSEKIKKAITATTSFLQLKNTSKPVAYGACGATASGFILDYLAANNIGKISSAWTTQANKDIRISMLRDKLQIASNSNITWPWNLSGALSAYSNYTTSTSSFWPTTSIKNNIPGISLRSLKCTSWNDITGGFHYRNVTGYKEDGWWIFKWKYIKVLDGNNKDSGWEAYIPLYHLKSWNVVRK